MELFNNRDSVVVYVSSPHFLDRFLKKIHVHFLKRVYFPSFRDYSLILVNVKLLSEWKIHLKNDDIVSGRDTNCNTTKFATDLLFKFNILNMDKFNTLTITQCFKINV